MTIKTKTDFEVQDVFVVEHGNYYRIPVLSIAGESVYAFANRRVGTVADNADEVHLVLKRWIQDQGLPLAAEDLFAESGWIAPIGSVVCDNSVNRMLLTYGVASGRRQRAGNVHNEANLAGAYQISFGQDKCAREVRRMKIGLNHLHRLGSSHGSSQGLLLKSGEKKGRVLMPGRYSLIPGEEIENLRQNHFNCALYSDDHGKTWQTSEPVQAGTGEGCLVELSDGRIYYNSRAYFLDGKRRIAWSYDSGETFTEFDVDDELTEPINGGCNAGMALYPPELSDGRDIILFSNPAGVKRERMTVRASFDMGQTWPVCRVIYEGPSAYSSMAVDKDGTIYVLFENGEKHPYEKISLSKFDLGWLMAE